MSASYFNHSGILFVPPRSDDFETKVTLNINSTFTLLGDGKLNFSR